MTPLQAILDWWESIDEPLRGGIAADVCFRLMRQMPHWSAREADRLLRGFLTEEVPAAWHVGRVLAIRAVIEFWFVRNSQRECSEMSLDDVGGATAEMKKRARASAERMRDYRKAMDTTLRRWRQLCHGSISDAALASFERTALGPTE